ncbi:PD-(D/E)XK nuclease family protein [Microvirga sp. VF16]|uniref:PD-(D/E)XK nuclease family protein n=1 Tax=Microvirga sp. VF16 TaxID=2807101 RepID=UPI00193E062E|nr:PD-(D/E)XK nuclease family protein [Microvirga sp. VF16]QRM27891.1 PD-(D/E)XK nuclease family protein [Microvirga sp. VF16]
MENLLTLTHATERDIDLLLVEELKCSSDFVRWFVNEAQGKGQSLGTFSTSSVAHSKRRTHNRREIDICLKLSPRAGLPSYVLIENKLDTSEQPHQAESYREEAELLVQRAEAAAVRSVLVCPSKYAEQNRTFAGKFNAVVLYEDISRYLAERSLGFDGELKARLNHRHELLEQAIQKSRRGYEAVPLPIIEEFNAKYVALCQKECPTLKPGPSMLKEGRPGESKTMIFAPDTLPDWSFLPQMRIVHQLREGNGNINFYGWGDHFTTLAATVAADLKGTPYRVVPTINKRANGRSGLMIVVETPQIDNLKGFDEQREAILSGMRAVDTLNAWIWKNRDAVEQWAETVART